MPKQDTQEHHVPTENPVLSVFKGPFPEDIVQEALSSGDPEKVTPIPPSDLTPLGKERILRREDLDKYIQDMERDQPIRKEDGWERHYNHAFLNLSKPQFINANTPIDLKKHTLAVFAFSLFYQTRAEMPQKGQHFLLVPRTDRKFINIVMDAQTYNKINPDENREMLTFVFTEGAPFAIEIKRK